MPASKNLHKCRSRDLSWPPQLVSICLELPAGTRRRPMNFKGHPERPRGGRQFSITRDCATVAVELSPRSAAAISDVESNFVDARRMLLSELLDIVRVREGNSDQPTAAVVQTFEHKYGLGEKPSGVRFRVLDLPRLDTARRAVSLPSGLRPEVVVHPDSNDIAGC
jgi:hypothetical protein